MLDRFFKPTNATTLSLFRILFGALMLYQLIYYFRLDYTFQFMAGPEFLFSYPYSSFFVTLPEGVLKGIHFGLILSTVMIIFGWFYRAAMIFFFLGITYFSFIDKTLYNNHLYLLSLISLVMIFMEADAKYSVQSKNKDTVPIWNVWLLQFLLVLVYSYGALAKLSPDWLNGNIPAVMIEEGNVGMLSFLPENVLLELLTYGGLVYDLLIGFILLWKPTRWIGLALVILFNMTNASLLFDDIGVFPYFMICATILFFDPQAVDNLINRLMPVKRSETKKAKKKQAKKAEQKIERSAAIPGTSAKYQKVTGICIALFVVFQLVWPFRSHLFTNNPEWTGHGSRFAWRMKMQSKKVTSFKMVVTDGPNGTPTEINHRSFLSVNQLKHLVDDPFLLVQFAKYLKQKAIREGMAKDPIVKATVMVVFNKRPAQLFIDPNVDLTKVEESPWADYDWIMPLQEDLN
ncbi:MAG: vitamin K-dependent gamma-carboxylase [Polaribacter sp.]|jgi:vitamin K-dependent gamma-carboxylase